MDYVFVFNAFETVLWTVIAIVLLGRAISQTELRRRTLLSAFVFIAFAATEVVEMKTGAWWRPWWLFVWKAACVMTLLSIAIYHYRFAASKAASDPNTGDAVDMPSLANSEDSATD